MASDDWTMTVGNVTVSVSHIGGGGGAGGLYLPARTWRRAAVIAGSLGADEALAELHDRAERALERGLVGSACQWRDVMAAIHAIARDERFEGEAMQ